MSFLGFSLTVSDSVAELSAASVSSSEISALTFLPFFRSLRTFLSSLPLARVSL